MLLPLPIKQGTSVSGKVYADKNIPAIVSHYTEAHPHTGVRGLKLLHNNVPAHKSTVVLRLFKINRLQALSYPAYNPDLSLCDFWMNPYIKQHLRRRLKFTPQLEKT